MKVAAANRAPFLNCGRSILLKNSANVQANTVVSLHNTLLLHSCRDYHILAVLHEYDKACHQTLLFLQGLGTPD